VSKAQAVQQRLEHVFALQSYGQFFSSSKVHRREGYLSFAQMQLVIFTLICWSSADSSSPAAAASRHRRQQSVHRPGDHDQVRATHITGAKGNGLGTTIKHL
jgi:hypothetical protein